MAYRMRARSATPGAWNFKANRLAFLPGQGDVDNGVGRGDGLDGTLVQPAEAQVQTGVQYGAGGTEFTGTMAGGGGIDPANIVDPAYVIVGHDNYTGGEAGTFAVPAEEDVEYGVTYGTAAEYTGTLAVPDYSSVTADAGRVQQICEAIVALLDAADLADAFYETIGATRVYTTLSDLSEVGDSVVAVVAPQMTERARNSNGTYGRYVVVDILVRIHLTNDADADRTTMDNRVYLLEQIDNYLAAPDNSDLTLPDDEIAEYIEPTDTRADSEIREGLGVLWDSDDLLGKRQVTGLVRVAYWVDESY
jgi:hypothetical protein